MDKRINKRRPCRPVSELITLFDHQEAEKSKASQWRSENALNLPKSPQITHKRNSASLSRSGNSEISKSSECVQAESVRDKSCVTGGKAGTRTARPPLQAKQTHGKTLEKTKKKVMEEKRRDKNDLDIPESLKKEAKQEKQAVRNNSDGDSESDTESCTRKKFPLDDSLAVLRREMHSLRKQDVELMSQLLALNSSIQDIKSSSSSMSNYSDTSDAETEIENNSPIRQAWHQRESSTGSDTSDFEIRRGTLRPTYKQSNVNRDSLGSEVSGYYSNPSPRSSYHGSKSSLNAYDVSGAESFVSRSECCSPQPSSPVSADPPFTHAYHCRQKTWLNQDLLGLGMTGSDPMLNRDFPDGDKLQPPVHSKAFHAGDEKVRRMSLQQKRLYSRRNTACSTLSDMSRSGSDHSLSGYDFDSDNSRTSVQSSRIQKWQRSKSTCALNGAHNSTSRTPIKNTIKVDLRNNPPTPGTAIELILPIQPLQPTRRNSALRMAERKQVNKLNSLSKRQSTIW
ncbi:uncharacterized protein LOC110252274 [Exaiptasia diaphana]|uniref:Uncharacterized protein n=1 Tax=Exaiptasia diaphana TaxID=2652724 RepID=A0A913Y3U3_EXADI|nr:uncharacterized protein LOC110252274 [Exaiptasia diaphana]KXJ29039.1 hypothetical protein AC249_AIPGENE1332 [Exaiptasia diaphana]